MSKDNSERVTLREGYSFENSPVIASVRSAKPVNVLNSLIRHFDPFQKWHDAEHARKVA